MTSSPIKAQMFERGMTYILCKYLYHPGFLAWSVVLKGKGHALFLYIIGLDVAPLELYHLRLKFHKMSRLVGKPMLWFLNRSDTNQAAQ